MADADGWAPIKLRLLGFQCADRLRCGGRIDADSANDRAAAYETRRKEVLWLRSLYRSAGG